jgi:RNA polymerase sigma-70 factor (ECF subfamily)
MATSKSASTIDPLELEEHRPQLIRFAMGQLRNAAHAEDVVQETLIAALQGIDRFAGNSSVRTWLTGILKHKIIDHFRRQSREAPLDGLEEELSLEDFDDLYRENGHLASAVPAPSWGDPEATLSQERFFAALEGCMDRLPKNTARAFHMREVLGMETGEICKALGITSTNCWVLLYRARMSLRACLQASWFGGERREAPGGHPDA